MLTVGQMKSGRREMFSDLLNGCSGTECECCSVILPEGVNGCDHTFKGVTDLTVQRICCAKTATSCSTFVPNFYPCLLYTSPSPRDRG